MGQRAKRGRKVATLARARAGHRAAPTRPGQIESNLQVDRGLCSAALAPSGCYPVGISCQLAANLGAGPQPPLTTTKGCAILCTDNRNGFLSLLLRDCIVGGLMARSEWVEDDVMRLILAAMMPANRLAIETSLSTGLRISDVLSLKTETLRKTARPYVRDSKTGKIHRIYIGVDLRQRLLAQAGRIWIFEGRTDPTKHRTRCAVYKDMTQAAAIFRRAGVTDVQHISPHSARKSAAVRAYDKGGFSAAQAMLCHDPEHPLITMIYALSDKPMPPSSKRRSKRSCAKSTRNPQRGQE